jgi:heptosyltransferase-2
MNVAVIQPLPGIGDMIWHLPHIRAIAAHTRGPVTLVAKPRSAADQIFRAEATVRDVIWLDRNPDNRRGQHDGGTGFARLINVLREPRFDAVYLLHHSKTLACLAMLAGIPARFGYGFGIQRLFLNRPPYLPPPVLRLHPFDQATAFLGVAGIPLPEAEPILPTAEAARAAVRLRLGPASGRQIAVGIGSSEPYKQWGAQRFAALCGALLDREAGRLVLIGGPAEASLAQDIQDLAGRGGDRIVTAIGWDLADIAAVCADCAFYVGNDTGVMNIAAAVGIPSYGLFGGTPPFHHSSRIIPILPPDGAVRSGDPTGMSRIEPDAVIRAIG